MKLLIFTMLAAGACAQPLPGLKSVIIFGVDGLGANVVRSSAPASFRSFQQESAFSLHARGVMPTVTFPNFGSMISGAGPEQHGIISNAWRPDKFDIAPTCQGRGGHFPTVFGMLRDQKPDAKSALFFDGGQGFPFIAEDGVADKVGIGQGADATMTLALDYIKASHPALVFLHVDLLDHAGHTYGWESPEYAQAVVHSGELLARLMAELRDASLLSSTAILISADHGGIGKRHGGSTMTELEIPWMLYGPGVAKGKELTAPINTYDTAATVASILGIKPSPCWIGRAVTEAFENR
jgi:predicted AlkP superfamily pyrophosphatase or phosphodiesterase